MATLEEILDARQQGTTAKFCFNPHERYDRKTFVGKMNKLKDLEEAYEAFSKNQGDIGAYNDLSEAVISNTPENLRKPQFEERIHSDTHFTLSWAYQYLTRGYNSLARYVASGTNRKEMLSKFSDKGLEQLFLNSLSAKTGNKEYDKISIIKERKKEMSKFEQEGKNPLDAITQDEIKEEISNYDSSLQELIIKYQATMIPIIAGFRKGKIEKEYKSLFKDKDGKLNRSAVIKYLEANYRVVEDKIEDSRVSDGERYDLWHKNLEPQYMQIAKLLHSPEKKEDKMQKDPEKEKRKEEFQALGLAA